MFVAIILFIILAISFFFLCRWSIRKINELNEEIANLKNEVEILKEKREIKIIEKPIEITKIEEEQPKSETKQPENTQRREPFHLGMPNAKGLLKEEAQRAGYFIAQEGSSNKAIFEFVNDQAKLNVIFKSDLEGKFYKVEKGIALPGKVLLKQTGGVLSKKGDFWAVLKPITIELGS